MKRISLAEGSAHFDKLEKSMIVNDIEMQVNQLEQDRN